MKKQINKLELHITLKCNLKCNNCNRLCNLYPEREEHMSPEQVEHFLSQVDYVGKMKVLGGEPLLNPQFDDIFDILVENVKKKKLGYVKFETNGTIKIDKSKVGINGIKWQGTTQPRKRHNPSTWAPNDLNIPARDMTKEACGIIRFCGFSLDNYGYLPCGNAVMIARLFGLTHLYKRDYPGGKPWGLDELCKHCFVAMDSDKWASTCPKIPRSKPLCQHDDPLDWTSLVEQGIATEEEILKLPKSYNDPSKSWKEALEKFDHEAFYKTQPEFGPNNAS